MIGAGVVRLLRGALGNAVVWAAGWFAAAFVVFQVLLVAGVLPESVFWADGLMVAARFAVVGGVAGGFFSAFLGLFCRGRRLSEIRWTRVGIGGGIAAGLLIPIFLQVMNLISGDGLVPWTLLLDDLPWTVVFGAVAGAGSIKLAQLSGALPPEERTDHPPVERLERPDPLESPDTRAGGRSEGLSEGRSEGREEGRVEEFVERLRERRSS